MFVCMFVCICACMYVCMYIYDIYNNNYHGSLYIFSTHYQLPEQYSTVFKRHQEDIDLIPVFKIHRIQEYVVPMKW